MRFLKQGFSGLVLIISSFSANADLLVLVHGYLGSAHSWEQSGVSQILADKGWQRGGLILPAAGGLQVLPASEEGRTQLSYAVELPSMAPVMVQADLLTAMVKDISQRHPDQSIILVGHSAGGVVARLALVRGTVPQVKALVTIASPHAGTVRALQALDETDSSGPLGFMKDFFGGGLYHTVKDSWGVLLDLTPPRPGNLLFWLNQQQHPEIAYFAISHLGPAGLGDELVPAYSQDMNSIPALAGRATLYPVVAPHELNPQDGVALLSILTQLPSGT